MRLIDADALEEEIVKTMRYVPKDAVLDVACMVNRAPTIEAKPVVHAHWEKEFFTNYRQRVCSVCFATVRQTLYDDGEPRLFNYCPWCGAQMDEVASDNNVGSKGVKIPVINMEDVPKIMEEMEK